MNHLKSTLLLITVILTIYACTKSKDNSQVVFPKPPEETFDSVGTWLSNENNCLTDKYLPFFETHFNKQIADNNIDSAARLLYFLGLAHNLNSLHDSVVLSKHLDFLSKYENQIKPRFRSALYINLGQQHYFNSDYLKGISYFQKNIVIPNDYYTEDHVAASYYGIAFDYMMLAQYDSAIVYGQKAMNIYEKNQDLEGQNSITRLLKGVYLYMSNYQEAQGYCHKILEISKVMKDSDKIFWAMHDISNIYDDMESPLLSSSVDTLVNFEKEWNPKNPKYRFLAQSALAFKYLTDSNYVEAGKILNQIAPMFPLIKDQYYTNRYIKTLTFYESSKGKPLSLRKIFLEKLDEAKSKKDFLNEWIYSEILYKEAKGLNDSKSMLKYLEAMTTAKDSFQNINIAAQARELEKKYQTERKEAQLQLQAEEALRKNVFIAMLLAGFAALFYFYYTLKKQKNIIAQQNELNEHTIAILSHDIKEPLLGVKLMLKKLNTNDPFVTQASQSLEGQINSVNGILTNLLKMKKLALTKKDKNAQANVFNVVNNVLQELNMAIQNKELTIQNDLNENLTLPITPEKLQIIVHNLLSNAIKYSFTHQKIRIFQEGKGFCIQDFGVGLSPEQRSKLMREVTASQQGTKQESGNGLGLFLVGTMLQGENIRVVFDSPEVGGTVAKVLG